MSPGQQNVGENGREDALTRNKPIYGDHNGCSDCGHKFVYRYTKNNECENCAHVAMLGDGPVHPTSAQAAKSEGLGYYYPHKEGIPQLCPHAPHIWKKAVGSRRCLTCDPPSSPGRPRAGNPRAVARNAGQKEYTTHCGACGLNTPHSVAHGKCLTCYSTIGQPRSPRVRARLAGLATYLSVCPSCDYQTPHSVHHGRCLECHAEDGTPHAANRYRGRPCYEEHCGHCGKSTPHSIGGGRCLICDRPGILARTADRAQQVREWLAVIEAMPGKVMTHEQAKALGSPIWRGSDGEIRPVE